MEEREPIYINCECGTEAIQLSEIINDDIIDGEKVILFKEYNFAIFKYGERKNDFFSRIRYAWYHLSTGKKHEDQILIHEKEIVKLKEFLNK